MKATVFYSWQSNSPKTNRNFIEDALEKAVKAIHNDDSISVEPVMDRDTAGLPGSPNIAEAIFNKIERASVFVGDVSFINQTGEAAGRKTPNPNVLIELGFALHALGPENVVSVLNKTSGSIEELPFDLKLRRVLSYSLGADAEAEVKADEKKKLTDTLQFHLREIFRHKEEQAKAQEEARATAIVSVPSPAQTAINAVESGSANQRSAVINFMRWYGQQLDGMKPVSATDSQPTYEPFFHAINTARPLVIQFAGVAEAIALNDAQDAARALHDGFKFLYERSHIQRGFSGQWPDFSFFRFEMLFAYLIFTGLLVKHGRYRLLSVVLATPVMVQNIRGTGAGPANFWDFNAHVEMADTWNSILDQQNRSLCSPTATIMHREMEQAELQARVLFTDLVDADMLMFIRSVNVADAAGDIWHPILAIHQQTHMPGFVVGLASLRFLDSGIMSALGTSGLEDLKRAIRKAQAEIPNRLPSRCPFGTMFGTFDAAAIGTKQ